MATLLGLLGATSGVIYMANVLINYLIYGTVVKGFGTSPYNKAMQIINKHIDRSMYHYTQYDTLGNEFTISLEIIKKLRDD